MRKAFFMKPGNQSPKFLDHSGLGIVASLQPSAQVGHPGKFFHQKVTPQKDTVTPSSRCSDSARRWYADYLEMIRFLKGSFRPRSPGKVLDQVLSLSKIESFQNKTISFPHRGSATRLQYHRTRP